MNNIISTSLSAKNKHTNGITHSRISRNVAGTLFPVLYVEGAESVKIYDGILTVEQESFELNGSTIIEAMQFLIDQGLTAELTHSKVSGYPASLLQDFQSLTPISFEVSTSPFKLSEHHAPTINNLVSIDGTSITRTVASIDGLDFEIQNDLVFVNDMTDSAQCVLNYSVNKYMLFAGRGSIANSYNMIDRQTINKHGTVDLISAINAENKDTLWQP